MGKALDEEVERLRAEVVALTAGIDAENRRSLDLRAQLAAMTAARDDLAGIAAEELEMRAHNVEAVAGQAGGFDESLVELARISISVGRDAIAALRKVGQP